MATTADFRNGMNLVIDNEIFSIVEFQHVKPGKGGAFVRTKLKNLKTGAVIDRTLRAGERVEEARVEERKMQYLYESGNLYYFMDLNTYDQIPLSESVLENQLNFLKETEIVSVLIHDSDPIGIVLPFFVELKVVETDPGMKGDTASGGSKPAKLESGVVIQVPLFINEGDMVKVDTRTGVYIERV